MKVHVEYFAQAQFAAGCAGEECELDPGANASDLARLLCTEERPDLKRLLLDDSRQVPAWIMIAVNGEVLHGDREQALQDGDVVRFMPPISGG